MVHVGAEGQLAPSSFEKLPKIVLDVSHGLESLGL